MFPGAHARVFYNDAGEPIGWDYPSEPDPSDWADEYDMHGGYDDDDDDDEKEPDE